MEINNKIAVITGAAGGIGVEIVKQLLSNGAKLVALFELDSSAARRVFAELKKNYGERVDFHPCDVANKAQFRDNFEKVLKRYGTIDILVNNAAIGTENLTESLIDINYKAVVLGSLLFIERLGKHKGGNGGVVVNIASILGMHNIPHMPIYCSAKHAVISFTRCLSEQYHDTGVRVVAVCPGKTDTSIIATVAPAVLDFVNTDDLFSEFPTQSPEIVGAAVVKIIRKGKSGEVWVSENGEPPYAVKDVKDFSSLRVSIDE